MLTSTQNVYMWATKQNYTEEQLNITEVETVCMCPDDLLFTGTLSHMQLGRLILQYAPA